MTIGAQATVASIVFPTGIYVVTAAVSGYANADPDGDADAGVTARCAVPGSVFTRATFVPYPDVRNMSVLGRVTRKTPGAIDVSCRLLDDDGSAYVSASLTAIKVATITTPYPYEQ